MQLRKTLLATVLAGLTASAFAAPVTYSVDPTHTHAGYEVSHLGFSIQSGVFTQTSGTVVLDNAAKKGSVDISIDANSLNSYLPARDKHLKSADFFNVAKYPTITFKSNDLVFSGDKLTEVKGNLTLLGVTKPVTLKITNFRGGKHPMAGGKQAYGANAEATIKRSDFGMGMMVPAISDDVKLDITIEAIAAS
ncbi:YceI family protein [Crenobacter sp. SG2303]|uniref:YceI family protein n=1 Tax=Crenobacter oryzisoli TaxID=3056844 RepID=A0ABT7XPZ9_9NEIS|nr:YceI family protein [Crenobacter sp. SG2303]MDN0075815.1 YceI family protein [Crenobacter sp. SG2303]